MELEEDLVCFPRVPRRTELLDLLVTLVDEVVNGLVEEIESYYRVVIDTVETIRYDTISSISIYMDLLVHIYLSEPQHSSPLSYVHYRFPLLQPGATSRLLQEQGKKGMEENSTTAHF